MGKNITAHAALNAACAEYGYMDYLPATDSFFTQTEGLP